MNLRYFKNSLTQIKQEISFSSHVNNNPVFFVCALLKRNFVVKEDQDLYNNNSNNRIFIQDNPSV